MRLSRQSLHPDIVALKERVTLVLCSKMHAEFSIDNVGDCKGSGVRRRLECRGGSFKVLGVRDQDVQQDVSIDRSDHRPRMSSMNLSTDEYPSLAKLSAQRPFHFERLSFLGAFFSTMEPLTTRNSTSVFGRRPNCSRMGLGIVTWPLSPILILYSMYVNSYLINPCAACSWVLASRQKSLFTMRRG